MTPPPSGPTGSPVRDVPAGGRSRPPWEPDPTWGPGPGEEHPTPRGAFDRWWAATAARDVDTAHETSLTGSASPDLPVWTRDVDAAVVGPPRAAAPPRARRGDAPARPDETWTRDRGEPPLPDRPGTPPSVATAAAGPGPGPATGPAAAWSTGHPAPPPGPFDDPRRPGWRDSRQLSPRGGGHPVPGPSAEAPAGPSWGAPAPVRAKRAPLVVVLIVVGALVLLLAGLVLAGVLGAGRNEAGRGRPGPTASPQAPSPPASTPTLTPTAAPATPPSPAPTAPAPVQVTPVVPGWQGVSDGMIAYDVPPDWSVFDAQETFGWRLKDGQGRTVTAAVATFAAVYREGFCAADPKGSSRAAIGIVDGGQVEATTAAEGAGRTWAEVIRRGGGGAATPVAVPPARSHTSSSGAFGSVPVAVTGVLVPLMASAFPCAPPAMHVTSVAVRGVGGRTRVVVVVTDQRVPDALSTDVLAKVVGSIRRVA